MDSADLSARNLKSGKRLLPSLLVPMTAIALLLPPPTVWGTDSSGFVQPAHAAVDPFAGMRPLADSELALHRGGFSIGKINIQVGVMIDTIIDDVLKVTTNYAIDTPGELTHIATEVTAFDKNGIVMPDVAAIVANAKPDVERIKSRIFNAAKPATENPDADHQEAAAKVAAATAIGVAEVVTATAKTIGSLAPAPNPAAEETDQTAASAKKATSPMVASVPTTKTNAGVGQASVPKLPVSPSVFEKGELSDNGASQPVKATSHVPVHTAKADTPVTPRPVAKPVSATPIPAKATVVKATASNTTASDTTPASANTPTRLADLAGAKAIGAGETSIIHSVGNGHLSVIENTMNNITVRQATSINLTLENFQQVREAARLQRSIADTARTVSFFSMRR